MLSNVNFMNGFGKITKAVQPNASIHAVIEFVEEHLDEFSNRYSHIVPEESLNYYLVSLLSKYSHQRKCLFRFQSEAKQDPQKGNCASVDIGVMSNVDEGVLIETKYYCADEPFFSLEAKRLGKLHKIREKEYLIGRMENEKYIECGGVERFKKGIHGKTLNYSAIIGYVQERDFNFWVTDINKWIEELIINSNESICWGEKDKLVEESIGITARYRSENSRLNLENITLFHLWVKMNKTSSQISQ
jgi:hypothetical protein